MSLGKRLAIAVYAFLAIWFPLAAVLSVGASLSSTSSGRPIMWTLAVIGVGSIAACCWFLWQGSIKIAGVLLLLSAVTPTVFFWLPNLVAIVMGLMLLTSRPREQMPQ